MSEEPPLIPNISNKISMDKWLSKLLPYETDFFTEDIIEDMSHRVYTWISSKEDIEPTINYDSFKSVFINLLYDKYLG